MRTSLWYSSWSRSARPVPAAFCTVGHAQRKHTATALLPCGNLSGPLLPLPVVSGNLLRVQMRAITQDIKSKKQRAIQPRPRGLVRISTETILDSIAEQQLVPENLRIPIEDRLPRDLAQTGRAPHTRARNT